MKVEEGTVCGFNEWKNALLILLGYGKVYESY